MKKDKKNKKNILSSDGVKKHFFAASVIIVLLSIIYSGSFDSPFLFDDRLNITENPYIRVTKLDFSQIKRAAVQDKFQLRLFSNFTFALDYYFHKLNLKYMHAENLALHAGASFLLYLIVYYFISSLLKDELSDLSKWLAALFSVLVWSVHPAHTQTVIYIVQRQTLMAVFFSLQSFLFYMLFTKAKNINKKIFFLVLCVTSFLVSSVCKEISWTVPLIIFLYEFLIRRQIGSKFEIKKTLIFSFSIFSTGAVGLFFLLKSELLTRYLGIYKVLDYGPWQRILTEGRVITSYLITIMFPYPSRLALDHDVAVSVSLFDPFTTFLAFLFILGSLVFGLFYLRKSPFPLFLILCFLIVLAPESSFIPVELKYDHRMYMPSLFFFPPFVIFIFRKLHNKKSAAIMTLWVLGLAVISFTRTAAWESEESIWSDAAAKYPELSRPWSNLCGALVEKGDLNNALLSCNRAIELAPNEEFPVLNKAIALMRLGKKEEAKDNFNKAAKMNPANDVARYNYGAFLEKENDLEAALTEYDAAIKANELHSLSRYRRALIYEKTGRSKEAIFELELLILMYPDFNLAKESLNKIKSQH